MIEILKFYLHKIEASANARLVCVCRAPLTEPNDDDLLASSCTLDHLQPQVIGISHDALLPPPAPLEEVTQPTASTHMAPAAIPVVGELPNNVVVAVPAPGPSLRRSSRNKQLYHGARVGAVERASKRKATIMDLPLKITPKPMKKGKLLPESSKLDKDAIISETEGAGSTLASRKHILSGPCWCRLPTV